MADKRVVMKWTDEVHSDILIAMSDSISFSNQQWAAIMAALKEKDYTFSESALNPSDVHNQATKPGFRKHRVSNTMPTNWEDPAVSATMLNAILLMVNFTGDDYQKIAERMTAQGIEMGKDPLRYVNLS
ncbi:hypothetical protein Micbo1qcDRAFT_199748 [Microdochium bolleyi]|uniref:Uncharacterized protein n=1 Tax=Microdochium bolleyi TaxID=196109 RepID=A0A136JIM9_9PEZI|nr:hypothetical protein Micbo1qcDRAFT_199748 [Microdochium bolleyi]